MLLMHTKLHSFQWRRTESITVWLLDAPCERHTKINCKMNNASVHQCINADYLQGTCLNSLLYFVLFFFTGFSVFCFHLNVIFVHFISLFIFFFLSLSLWMASILTVVMARRTEIKSYRKHWREMNWHFDIKHLSFLTALLECKFQGYLWDGAGDAHGVLFSPHFPIFNDICSTIGLYPEGVVPLLREIES